MSHFSEKNATKLKAERKIYSLFLVSVNEPEGSLKALLHNYCMALVPDRCRVQSGRHSALCGGGDPVRQRARDEGGLHRSPEA